MNATMLANMSGDTSNWTADILTREGFAGVVTVRFTNGQQTIRIRQHNADGMLGDITHTWEAQFGRQYSRDQIADLIEEAYGSKDS